MGQGKLAAMLEAWDEATNAFRFSLTTLRALLPEGDSEIESTVQLLQVKKKGRLCDGLRRVVC